MPSSLAQALLVLLAVGHWHVGAHAINPGGFPNSITAPIRGWRSWNAVFSDVTQSFIERQVDGISQRRLKVGPKLTSLLDLGFSRVGIDSGWASCLGVNGSWHDAEGQPVVNLTSFPSMKKMVDYGHSKGVSMGFYLNQDLDPGYHSCKSEGQIPGAAANTGNPHYTQDAQFTAAMGFDGVKFDAGGGNDNMTLWALAINATGRPMMLENCNNGGDVPYGLYHGPRKPYPKGHDQGCPFNMFRTGIDNAPSPLSTVSNLMDVSMYLNVSKPGCWAYPDMLEMGAPVVGKFAATSPRDGPDSPRRESTCGPHDGTKGDTAPRLSMEQAKAQYAAWCSVSAPLILGFDMLNETEYDRWFPIISNTLALEVQADWAGVAGRLVARSAETVTTVVPHGASCEDMKDTRALPAWSVWGKPLRGGRYALTAINTQATRPAHVSVPIGSLGLHSGDFKETDVWSGLVKRLRGTAWTATLPSGAGSHRFVVLAPIDK